MQEPQSTADILAILGDTADSEYPIFRRGEHGGYTLCTAFFDLGRATCRSLEFYLSSLLVKVSGRFVLVSCARLVSVGKLFGGAVK